MLMHTRGILVMAPSGAMVLTGKQALDYSGAVSAEDNFGIGGYERIMGPNGQAQYWATDVAGACRILLSHYEHTYVAPGERFPRRATTADPIDRDVRDAPHHAPGSALAPRRRRLLRREQPRAQAAVRHPQRSCAQRSTPTTRRSSAGPTCAAPRRRWSGTPTSAAGRSPCSASSRGRLQRHGVLPGRRARAVDARARCSRARPRRSRARSTPPAAGGPSSCSPTWPASTARRSRCASGSSSTAPRSGARWSTSTARSSSAWSPDTTAAPSWCSPSGSTPSSRRWRWRARTRRSSAARPRPASCSPATSRRPPRQDPRIAELDARIDGGRGCRAPAACAPSAPSAATPCWPRSAASSRPQFDAAHSVERAVAMGSVRRIIAPGTLRPYLIDAVERGMQRATGRARGSPDGHAELASRARSLTSRPTTAGSAPRERDVLAGPARRQAARATGGWGAGPPRRPSARGSSVEPGRVEVLAAPDGAPEAWRRRRARARCRSRSATAPGGRWRSWPPPRAASAAISSSSSRAATPSSREWLAPSEQALVRGAAGERSRPCSPTSSGRPRRRPPRRAARGCGSTCAAPSSSPSSRSGGPRADGAPCASRGRKAPTWRWRERAGLGHGRGEQGPASGGSTDGPCGSAPPIHGGPTMESCRRRGRLP